MKINSTLKYMILALIAGMVVAAYRGFQPTIMEKLNSFFSTEVELIGTLALVPKSQMGYIELDGAYNTETERLAFLSQGKYYLLIFNNQSDLSALLDTQPSQSNSVQIGGRTIYYTHSASYRVLGRKSSYTGLIPLGPLTLSNGRVVDNYKTDTNSDYYKIIVNKISAL